MTYLFKALIIVYLLSNINFHEMFVSQKGTVFEETSKVM